MLEIAGYIVITLIILILLCAGFHEVIKCYVEGKGNDGPEWYVKPNGKAATTSEEVFTSEKGKRLLEKYSKQDVTVHRAFDKGSPEGEDYSFGLPEVTDCPPMPPVKPVRKGSNPEPSEPRPKAPPNPPRINSEEGEESKVGYPTGYVQTYSDHVRVSFTGTKSVDVKSILTNNYAKVFSSLKERYEGDYTQEDFERNINLCDEVEQIRKDIRSKLHACATNSVPVNRGTPDKYTQEASEQMTVENLEKAVKDEIKRMEDWK